MPAAGPGGSRCGSEAVRRRRPHGLETGSGESVSRGAGAGEARRAPGRGAGGRSAGAVRARRAAGSRPLVGARRERRPGTVGPAPLSLPSTAATGGTSSPPASDPAAAASPASAAAPPVPGPPPAAPGALVVPPVPGVAGPARIAPPLLKPPIEIAVAGGPPAGGRLRQAQSVCLPGASGHRPVRAIRAHHGGRRDGCRCCGQRRILEPGLGGADRRRAGGRRCRRCGVGLAAAACATRPGRAGRPGGRRRNGRRTRIAGARAGLGGDGAACGTRRGRTRRAAGVRSPWPASMTRMRNS